MEVCEMEMSRKAVPYTPNDKPLREMTIAIVSTAGAHLTDDEPFNTDGDASYRLMTGDVQTSQFTVTHGAPKEHYNTDEPKQDINVIFPLDRLRELEEEGYIGGVNNKHISMMGYAMRLKQILDETVPQVAKEITKSKADAVLLTAG
jgi:D-proline reductase (dithiol) PrdB